MRKFRGILQTNREPEDEHIIWLNNNRLYYFNRGKWEHIANTIDMSPVLNEIDKVNNRIDNIDFENYVTTIIINGDKKHPEKGVINLGTITGGNNEINLADYAKKSDLDTKVDKINGKGLSTNDFTTDFKNKLNGIAGGAEVNVQSDWNEDKEQSDAYIKNKPTFRTINNHSIIGSGNISITTSDGALDLSEYATKEEFDVLAESADERLSQLEQNVTDLSDVARTGAYDDLIDPPNVVTKVKINGVAKTPVNGTVDLGTIIGDGSVDLSEYATKEEFDVLAESADERLSQLEQNVTDLSDVARSGAYADLEGKPTFRTINGESILGSGDIEITGGSSDLSKYLTKNEFQASLSQIEASYDRTVRTIIINNQELQPEDGIVYINTLGCYEEKAMTQEGSASNPIVLLPNVFYVWNEVNNLYISLDNEIANVTNEYIIQFKCPDNNATQLVIQGNVKWANEESISIKKGKTYQISILKGLGSFLEF